MKYNENVEIYRIEECASIKHPRFFKKGKAKKKLADKSKTFDCFRGTSFKHTKEKFNASL
jgi:hypothetical protein